MSIAEIKADESKSRGWLLDWFTFLLRLWEFKAAQGRARCLRIYVDANKAKFMISSWGESPPVLHSPFIAF